MTSLQDIQKRFTDEIKYVDEVAQIVLKGHLVMDSLMTEAIETFFLHGEFIEDARLHVSQKIAICRAISTSDQNNPMWKLISGLNSLRNTLSHSLDPDRRSKAIEKLRALYEAEFKDMSNSTKGVPNNIGKDLPADMVVCLYAFAGAHGYLHAHLEEVRRLKAVVLALDAEMNKGSIQRSSRQP